jgi:hypothetical protein
MTPRLAPFDDLIANAPANGATGVLLIVCMIVLFGALFTQYGKGSPDA